MSETTNLPAHDLFQTALDAIERGADRAHATGGVADPAARSDIAALLDTLEAAGDLPSLDAERRAGQRAALDALHAELYPPPTPVGRLGGPPGAPLVALVAVGTLLVGWLALRPAQPPANAPIVTDIGRGGVTWSRTIAAPDTGMPSGAASAAAPTGPGADPASRTVPAADAERSANHPSAGAAPQESPATTATELTAAATRAADGSGTNRAGTSTPPTPPGAPHATRRVVPSTELSPGNQDGAVAVTGRVVDGNGRGIGDALVTAYRTDASGFVVQRTAADGTYRLWLRAGAYAIQAEAEGHGEQWYAGAQGRSDATFVVVEGGRPAPRGLDFVLIGDTTHDAGGDPPNGYNP